MRQPLAGLFVLALRCGWWSTVAASGCSSEGGACVCEDDDGNAWDVSELSGSGLREPTTGTSTLQGPTTGCSICVGSWNYHWDICANIAVPQALGCSTTFATAAIRLDEFSTPTSRECEYLGPDVSGAGSPDVARLSGEAGDGLSLAYSYQSRSFTVNLLCGGASGSQAEPVAMGGNSIEVTWETPVACTGGSGWGWLTIILTGVAAGVYVGGGIGYAKRNEPALSLAEAHPHTEQWRQLPGLVSDGVLFTRSELSSRFDFLSFLAPAGGAYSDLQGRGAAKAAAREPSDRQELLAAGDEEKGDAGGGKRTKKRSSKRSPKPKPRARSSSRGNVEGKVDDIEVREKSEGGGEGLE